MSVAFELREEHKKGFAGGSVALPRGETFDIGQALEDGDGVIITDDLVQIDRLQRVEALQQVPGEDEPEPEETEDEPAESPDGNDDAGDWLGGNREEA